MAYRYSCSHLNNITNIPLTTIINSREPQVCADCDCQGPDLWICLQRNCLKIGCCEKFNDHSNLHNVTQPSHCVHMNLTTRRIWCHQCKKELYLDMPQYNDSDQETESCPLKSLDSGHGSYSTLRTTTPERRAVFGFDTVGLNVGMGGDASESSEGEDNVEYNDDKPCGLVGLQNIGNTCYMNAALQALSNTEPLTKFFLDCALVVQLLSEGRKPGLSRTYESLMRDIWIKKNGGYVTPSGILYGIRSVHAMFRGYHQHDTQEFLRNFMDQLHEELKQIAAPEPNITSDADTFSLAMDEPALSSSYDSSEGEYETCDSGVSERSSLSDDTERPSSSAKRRLSRCGSPNRRQRQRVQNASIIDSQPSTSAQGLNLNHKRQPKYRSIISDIFDGKLLSSVQCLTCDRVSSRVETFQDLSLPIPSRDHLVVLHGRPPGPVATCTEAVLPVQDGWMSWIVAWLRSWFYGPTVTLHDCLAAFFSTDELKGDNMYSCEKCNKLRNGIKFSKVLQLPEVLCIHLKRFRHELMFSSKISSAVSFPLKGLDMRPYLHGDCISKVSSYELFSVICHHGTAGGGHYICYALNSGQWFEFDDQYVTKVTAERVQSCEAYVLFYRKTTTAADALRKKAVLLAEESVDNMERTYISRQWLNRFNYCAEPGPIDNSDFLCHHGSINPDRSYVLDQLAIGIPLEVYEYLHRKFGGCAPVTSLHLCPACQAIQKRLCFEMETFVQTSREAQSVDASTTHYLSNSWYRQWHNFVHKDSHEPPGPIDNSKINLNQLDMNEAAEVPECIWSFFYNIYGGGPELKIRAVPIERVESEESLKSKPCVQSEESSQSEDESVVVPTENSIVNNNSNGNDKDFVIPRLKNKAEKDASMLIDKSLYSHGEPPVGEQELTNGAMPTVINKDKCNGDDSNKMEMEEEEEDSAKVNNDEISEVEARKIRNAGRNRRRRKFLVVRDIV